MQAFGDESLHLLGCRPQADARKRKLRLQQVLEQQRKLGHYEASKECGALASAGDQSAGDARKKQRQNETPREKGAPLSHAVMRLGVALTLSTMLTRTLDHAMGAKQHASSSADDESRRLREREAALVRTCSPPHRMHR